MNARTMIAVGLVAALGAGCQKPQSAPPPQEVRAVQVTALPAKADDAAWAQAPVFAGDLKPQDMVEPRKFTPGARQVQVRALTDGKSIGFLLEWEDGTADTARAPGRFGDACAVQMPETASPDVPAPQMGEQGKRVAISFWSAALQEALSRKGDEVDALYPNAKIDHYPFTAAPLEQNPAAREAMEVMYSPAVAAGNIVAAPPTKPVQDLVAEGPGTLAAAAESPSNGSGQRTGKGWKVMLTRPLPKGIGLGSHGTVAFAVWDGSKEDAGSRKMWVPWTKVAVGWSAAASH